MSLLNRLKAYIEHTKLPLSQFADNAGIPRPTLSQITSGRNKKISNELLVKLHKAYPQLNISWLLFGDEPMLTDGTLAPAPKPEEPIMSAPGPEQDPNPTIASPDPEMAVEDETSEAVLGKLLSSSVSASEGKQIDYIIVIFKDSTHAFFRKSN